MDLPLGSSRRFSLPPYLIKLGACLGFPSAGRLSWSFSRKTCLTLHDSDWLRVRSSIKGLPPLVCPLTLSDTTTLHNFILHVERYFHRAELLSAAISIYIQSVRGLLSEYEVMTIPNQGAAE